MVSQQTESSHGPATADRDQSADNTAEAAIMAFPGLPRHVQAMVILALPAEDVRAGEGTFATQDRSTCTPRRSTDLPRGFCEGGVSGNGGIGIPS